MLCYILCYIMLYYNILNYVILNYMIIGLYGCFWHSGYHFILLYNDGFAQAKCQKVQHMSLRNMGACGHLSKMDQYPCLWSHDQWTRFSDERFAVVPQAKVWAARTEMVKFQAQINQSLIRFRVEPLIHPLIWVSYSITYIPSLNCFS